MRDSGVGVGSARMAAQPSALDRLGDLGISRPNQASRPKRATLGWWNLLGQSPGATSRGLLGQGLVSQVRSGARAVAAGTRRGGRWESAEAARLTGASGLGAAPAHVAAPRPRPPHPPRPGQGRVAVPSWLKTPRCQRAARSQPLKGRQALYCSIITRSQMVFWELPPLAPRGRPHSFRRRPRH